MNLDSTISDTLQRLLASWIKIACSQRTDAQTIKVIRTKVIPLIRCFLHPKKWEKERELFLQQYKELEKKAVSEIQNAFNKLKSRIEAEESDFQSKFQQHICIIASMLKFRPEDRKAQEITEEDGFSSFLCNNCGSQMSGHRPYVFPSYAQGLYEMMSQFCCDLLAQGRDDLLSDLVKVKELRVDKGNSDAASPEDAATKEIEEIIFARTIFELIELDCVRNTIGRDMPPWRAWDIISTLEWAKEEKTRDILRKGRLRYDSIKAYGRRGRLLEQHDAVAQIKATKSKQQGTMYNVYKRRVLAILLNVICNAVKNDDENYPIVPLYPDNLELQLKDNRLCLYVEWVPGLIEVLHMHTFKEKFDRHTGDDAPNKIFTFVEKLLASPGTWVDHPLGPKVNVEKYLSKIGLKKVLCSLFIDIKSGTSVRLKAKRIALRDVPELRWEPLLKELNKFKTHEFRN